MGKSNNTIFGRYTEIIKYLLKGQYSVKMLSKHLSFKVTDRQIRNNLTELRDYYGFEIENNKKGFYWIDNIQNQQELVLNQFSFMSISAKIINNMQNGNFVQFERANFIKQTHLEELVEVCKNHEIISLQYENFWWGKLRYEVEPYLLKQFRNRWYVIAKITNIIKQENQNTRVKENEIYNFALDRILNIENTKKTFKAPNFDANEFYKDCFGIIKPSKSENETPQEIELCFEEIQGRYLKKLPLHHSQEILKERETKDHIFIRLKVYITYDFVQEILHFGETVKVIAPQSFKDKIMKEVSNQIVKYYDENDELLSRSDIY